jgi:hypothetical protein
MTITQSLLHQQLALNHQDPDRMPDEDLDDLEAAYDAQEDEAFEQQRDSDLMRGY